jgi:thioredoxin reductase (NADPH)
MYDVCIIGGGPAGLTAALYLARYHLTMCVIDAGKSRAALIPQSHNQSFFPDGISGAELLERMRSHLAKYPVGFEDSLVDNVEMVADGFQVRTRRVMIPARAVLMATGVENHRPAMSDEHHAVALRDGLLRYCPICDGYEITDRTVAVVGAGNHLFGEAKFLRSYTSKIVVFAEGSPIGLTSDQREELMSMDVRIIDTPASAYRLRDTAIEILLGSKWQAFDTMYAALGSTIGSGIVRGLAPDMTEEGCLIVDAHQKTSVPGLYAAGDVVVGVDQIAHAMGQATVAATAIRNDLSKKHALIRRAPGVSRNPLDVVPLES